MAAGILNAVGNSKRSLLYLAIASITNIVLDLLLIREMCIRDRRSNGLKWFLNLFIDLAYGNLENKTIIYLLDEPGVYLHVNAQRELLVLLKNLCNKGGQVVYTTHSPVSYTHL